MNDDLPQWPRCSWCQRSIVPVGGTVKGHPDWGAMCFIYNQNLALTPNQNKIVCAFFCRECWVEVSWPDISEQANRDAERVYRTLKRSGVRIRSLHSHPTPWRRDFKRRVRKEFNPVPGAIPLCFETPRGRLVQFRIIFPRRDWN